MTYAIKICGITNQFDLDLIARCGADYGGVLVEIESARGVKLAGALDLFAEPPLPMVAVTLDRNADELAEWMQGLRPTALQMHGYETKETVADVKRRVNCEIWKVLHLPAAQEGGSVDVDAVIEEMKEYVECGVDRFLVDATIESEGKTILGGTGKTVDWRIARAICERSPKPFIVAGGIHPGNAVEAATTVKPFGIDLSSGVEQSKGKKDPDKVLQLIARVRACETGDSVC